MEKDSKHTIGEIVEILKEIEILSKNSPLKHINEKELKFTSKSLFKYKIDFIKSLYEEVSSKIFELGELEENESRVSFSPSKSIRFNMNDNSNDAKDALNSVFDYMKNLEIQFSLYNQSLDLVLERWKILNNGRQIKKMKSLDSSSESTIVSELISKFERKNFHNVENLTRCLDNLEKDKVGLKMKIDHLLGSMSSMSNDVFPINDSLGMRKKLNKSTLTAVCRIQEIKEVEEKKDTQENVVVKIEKIYLGLMECTIVKSIGKISKTLSDTNSSTCLSVENESSYLAIQESYGLALVIDNMEFYSSKPQKSKPSFFHLLKKIQILIFPPYQATTTMQPSATATTSCTNTHPRPSGLKQRTPITQENGSG